MPRSWFKTWCSSLASMVAFQARRFALVAWAFLVIAVGIGFVKLGNLGQQNEDRITDIQQSRYEACRLTYQSFHVIFDPFFPPPDNRTPKQRRDFIKFDKIIKTQVKTCRRQVTPPSINPK